MATVEVEMFKQVQCGAMGRDGNTSEANQSIYEKDIKNYWNLTQLKTSKERLKGVNVLGSLVVLLEAVDY